MPRNAKNREKRKHAVQFSSEEGIQYTSLKRAREYVADYRAKWVVEGSILEFIPESHRNQAVQRSIETDQQATSQKHEYKLEVLKYPNIRTGALRTFAPYPETDVVLF